MSRLKAVKKTWAMSCRFMPDPWSRLRCFFDALGCGIRHGASPENYFVLHFFDMDEKQRALFLTSGRSRAADAQLNRNAAERDKKLIGRKELFDAGFSGLVKRDFLYVPEGGREGFEAFLRRHDSFIVKPSCGTMGHGIEKLCTAGLDREAFYARCCGEKLLLEELIVQHPALAEINRDSVNTVRVNAARASSGDVRFIGACLKCGGAGAVTDNFHSGGLAYPLDMETGRVTGPGRSNKNLTEYMRHPGSGRYMPGFSVPFWPQVLEIVKQGMDRVASLGYVGWDIAIRPDGPELVEGNYNWPGGNIIQFDGVGKYPLILDCLGDGNERDIKK